MPRQWRPLVDEMTRVQRLVHLAMRWGVDEVERLRGELLHQLRDEYEHELTLMAQQVGCVGMGARLQEGPILSMLNRQAQTWAEGIANTYNYDLARAIVHISEEAPRANRYVYAARLRRWEEERAQWKNQQIANYTSAWARARAQEDFRRYNGILGYAELLPKVAVCPICVGMVARGRIPLREALNDSPPYHPNCPHRWHIVSNKLSPEECATLWMGE